jgi:hypothetical protein
MRASRTLLFVVAAAAARAGDAPAPAGDSLAAAKKDFASIKSPAPETGPGLPGLVVRDEGSGAVRADAPLPLQAGRSAADPAGKKGGAGNWLVDAVEQETVRPQSARGDNDLIRGDLDLLDDAGRPESRAGSVGRAAEAGEKAASRELALSVSNPLDAFMEGWISAHDRGLLVPAKNGGNPMDGARAETLAGIDLGRREGTIEGVLASREGQADPRAAANPYILDLDLAPVKPIPVPDLAGFEPLSLADLSHGVPAPAAGSKFLDPSNSLIPDFAQPSDDDKYFKQMKRF